MQTHRAKGTQPAPDVYPHNVPTTRNRTLRESFRAEWPCERYSFLHVTVLGYHSDTAHAHLRYGPRSMTMSKISGSGLGQIIRYIQGTDRTHTHDSGLSCRRAEHAPVDSVTAFPQGLRLTDTHNSQLNSTLSNSSTLQPHASPSPVGHGLHRLLPHVHAVRHLPHLVHVCRWKGGVGDVVRGPSGLAEARRGWPRLAEAG